MALRAALSAGGSTRAAAARPSSAVSATLLRAVLAAALAAAPASAFLPPQNPPWPPAWSMAESTINMFANFSGWYNASFAASFGVSQIDWSNDKREWVLGHPMDDEERLYAQAAMVKAAGGPRVGVYLNLVKALPWMASVRRALDDPDYAGFFLRFKPGGAFPNGTWHVPACDTAFDPPKCSPYYHDQLQTPGVPGGVNPHPDGVCNVTCDVGSQPAGEYLWDWRNASLTQYIIDNVVFGPHALGSDLIDIVFIDDFWCSNLLNGTGACTDPVQGPTEVDPNSQADMGLSDEDVRALTEGWLAGFTAVQAAILAAGKYAWSLMPGQDNANAMPLVLPGDAAGCAAAVRAGCAGAFARAPLLAGLYYNASGPPAGAWPHAAQDVAGFLLMRGPHAWLGAGQWGVGWPDPSVPRPPQMTAEYGAPLDAACAEGPPRVFSRRYEAAAVALDCNTFEATFTPARAAAE